MHVRNLIVGLFLWTSPLEFALEFGIYVNTFFVCVLLCIFHVDPIMAVEKTNQLRSYKVFKIQSSKNFNCQISLYDLCLSVEKPL